MSLLHYLHMHVYASPVDALSESEVSAIEGRWRELVPRALILPVSALTVKAYSIVLSILIF